ncbi:MAG: glycine/sarcosine/betaine reductase selenoprotein B family protein [Candidatus Rokuibacteriota bacterium]
MSAPPTRADAGWIPEFRAGYDVWAPSALPLIRAHQYGEAFKSYPFPAFAETPWAPFAEPFSRVRLAVVTTAGVYRPGVDPPFPDTEEGDPRVLELPADVRLADVDVSHAHIPQDVARADMNVVLPLDRLRELVGEGKLGGLAPRIISVVGYRTRAHDVARDTAPAIARTLVEDGAALALVVPV